MKCTLVLCALIVVVRGQLSGRTAPPCGLPPVTSQLPQDTQEQVQAIWANYVPGNDCVEKQTQTRAIILALPEDVRRKLSPPCGIPPFTHILPADAQLQVLNIWASYTEGDCKSHQEQTRAVLDALPEDVKASLRPKPQPQPPQQPLQPQSEIQQPQGQFPQQGSLGQSSLGQSSLGQSSLGQSQFPDQSQNQFSGQQFPQQPQGGFQPLIHPQSQLPVQAQGILSQQGGAFPSPIQPQISQQGFPQQSGFPQSNGFGLPHSQINTGSQIQSQLPVQPIVSSDNKQ